MNEIVWQTRLPGGQSLQVVRGDLTEEPVDAIVNAANARLAHGGGVAGAIARGGGRQIELESEAWIRRHGPVEHAVPAVTGGGKLPCRFVIHAVGPVWGEGDEDRKLAEAVAGSLRRADELALKSISFPAISTGIFGFPRKRAAAVILEAILNHFGNTEQTQLDQVRLVLFDREAVTEFLEEWKPKLNSPNG